jgi:hypothetical protein
MKQRGDPVGITRSRGKGIRTAHAIAMAVDRTPLHLVLLPNKREHRADVVHDRGNGHLGTDGSHTLVLGAALFLHIRSIDRNAPAR